MTQCPLCKKATDKDFRPFCSKRCSNIDLGRWMTDSYRIETDEKAKNTSEYEDEA